MVDQIKTNKQGRSFEVMAKLGIFENLESQCSGSKGRTLAISRRPIAVGSD